MTEPQAIADRVEQVARGVWQWHVHDERIDFISSAYAFASDEGTVLIDPLPLAEAALGELGDVHAICLTAGSHQRSAWRLRRELGAPVWAPTLSRELEESADVRYGAGDVLPGGLAAYFTPGAGTTQHTLLLADRGIAFVPDLLLRPEGGELEILPSKYAHDPDEQRRSIEKVLELPFSILCLAHGGPITDDVKGSIQLALAQAASS